MRTWLGSTNRPDLYLAFTTTFSMATGVSESLIAPVNTRLDNHISLYSQMVLSRHLTRLAYMTKHLHK
ncbi:hypothetical protein HanXRQr2_Chr11g0481361 [Helianthus annuus]|uniref:Uncharacterized protein n=1 Tax=Helianthus annuus TaxID=4232 RepID=A0A9K3HN06_HELAN|nr:hypothetical protein HanXRQr2_Chr11g0481361 [Helianthus annuus]